MKKIYVECKPDKLLIELLVGTATSTIIHTAGKGRVISRTSRGGAVGIVDEDPGSPQPKKLSTEYRLLEDIAEHGVKIYVHNDLDSYIVMLSPRLEEWVLEACKEIQVDPSIYGLPRDPDEFHRVVNIRLTEYSKLLKHLIDKGSKRLVILKTKLMQLIL